MRGMAFASGVLTVVAFIFAFEGDPWATMAATLMATSCGFAAAFESGS